MRAEEETHLGRGHPRTNDTHTQSSELVVAAEQDARSARTPGSSTLTVCEEEMRKNEEEKVTVRVEQDTDSVRSRNEEE